MNNAALAPNCAGIITGASSGIGKALAILLAKEQQARLVICARSKDQLANTANEIVQFGGQAITICGDLGEDQSLPKRIVETCLQKFGQLDLLVNNAGLAKPGQMTKLSLADWQRVFQVNFFAALALTYEVLPYFIERKQGKIVNISSIAGKISFPGSVCYAASKFALTALSEGLAAEVSGKGLDVITVCPGWVRTEFFSKNAMSDRKNPTVIANKNDLKGIVMRTFLSISAEQAAQDIYNAMARGGSREIILTTFGVVIERMKAMFPGLFATMTAHIPIEMLESDAGR